VSRLIRLLDELDDWIRRINLTQSWNVQRDHEALARQPFDSTPFYAARALPISAQAPDFPGLPLALINPTSNSR